MTYATTKQLNNVENRLLKAIETQAKKTEKTLTKAMSANSSEILEIISTFAVQVDTRFNSLEGRMYSMEEKVGRIDKTVQKLDEDNTAFADSIIQLYKNDKKLEKRIAVLEKVKV